MRRNCAPRSIFFCTRRSPRKLILIVPTTSNILMYEFLTAHPHTSSGLQSISSLSTPTSPAVIGAFRQTGRSTTCFMCPLFDIWHPAILEPTIAQATLTPLVKVLASTNETCDTPYTAAPYHQRPRHVVAFPIATTSRGSPRREGSAHEHARADASAPGPACVRGGREPVV